MKLSKEGQTLFTVLCALFTDKAGHALKRRAYGEQASLVATRNEDGHINKIEMVFRPNKEQTVTVMSIDALRNEVAVGDASQGLTQIVVNRLNKVLANVDLTIRKQEGNWLIEDKAGQMAQFQIGQPINLARPHGSAIYQPTEEVTPAQ